MFGLGLATAARSDAGSWFDSKKQGRKVYFSECAAVIGFDSILNEIIDMEIWRTNTKSRDRLTHRAVSKNSNLEDFDLMKLPLSQMPFYTILMFPMLNKMLKPFVLGNVETYGKDANRHVAIHTVSKKQYKNSDAILTIMSVASICRVTDLQGKSWMMSAFEDYGFYLDQ